MNLADYTPDQLEAAERSAFDKLESHYSGRGNLTMIADGYDTAWYYVRMLQDCRRDVWIDAFMEALEQQGEVHAV